MAVGHASLYAVQRPWLFLAMAPSVLCALFVLTPMSLMGLVFIVPGLSGFAGLAGLIMAWCGLAAPGIVARRGGTIAMLLLASLPAIGLGLATLPHAHTPHHTVDPISVLGPASAIFGLLAAFFLAGVASGYSSEPAESMARHARTWSWAGSLAALLGLLLPAWCFLSFSGYGERIKEAQGMQAEALSQTAISAVDTFRASHQGALPLDNASVNLPPPKAMQDTYVSSVNVNRGRIMLVYRDNLLARSFGAGASDIVLTFVPADLGGKPLVSSHGAWSCRATGYRLEEDHPLLLHGHCRNG